MVCRAVGPPPGQAGDEHGERLWQLEPVGSQHDRDGVAVAVHVGGGDHAGGWA